MERKNHTIDASGKVLGRLASEIAILLRGKQKPEFIPYKDVGDFVTVKNINKAKITGKKIEKKIYHYHTGYLGKLKAVPFKKIFEKDPARAFKKIVFGMLPKNKLRDKQIKRLKIR